MKIGLVALCHATIQEKYACELVIALILCLCEGLTLTSMSLYPTADIFDLMSSGRDQISFSTMKIIIQDLLQV